MLKESPQAVEEMTEGLTINIVAELTGLGAAYIRKCIREGKLESELVQMEGRETKRHEMTREAVDAWMEGKGSRVGKRDDGRNKYSLYLTPEELVEVIAGMEGINGEGDWDGHLEDESDLFFKGNQSPSAKAAKKE